MPKLLNSPKDSLVILLTKIKGLELGIGLSVERLLSEPVTIHLNQA